MILWGWGGGGGMHDQNIEHQCKRAKSMIIQNHLTEEHNSNYCSSILYNSFYQIVCHEEG